MEVKVTETVSVQTDCSPREDHRRRQEQQRRRRETKDKNTKNPSSLNSVVECFTGESKARDYEEFSIQGVKKIKICQCKYGNICLCKCVKVQTVKL